MKRGQVTLYVIIAILIVVAAGILIYVQRAAVLSQFGYIPSYIRPIKTYSDECLKSTLENGIYLVGMQGGFVETPAMSFETNFSIIAYSYLTGRNLFPNITKVESQLSDYINTMLPQCVDFSKWPDFTVSANQVKSNVMILENEVLADANWPLTIEKGSTYQLNKFSTRLPVRLGLIHGIASTIVDKAMKDPTHIDLSYIIDTNENYNLSIDLVPYNNTLVYSISDPQSIVFSRPYVFFIAKRS